MSLDALLDRAEAEAGERAHHLVVAIDGALGGEVMVTISALLAPGGPGTPVEDIWSRPVALTTLSCGSSEVASARLAWVDRISAERKLAASEVTRHYRVGTRGYLGDAETVGMLLDARLHMARRALESSAEDLALHGGVLAHPRACTVENDGETLRLVADFTNKGAIELFSVKRPAADVEHAVLSWVKAR